jgi:hypothetical protein
MSALIQWSSLQKSVGKLMPNGFYEIDPCLLQSFNEIAKSLKKVSKFTPKRFNEIDPGLKKLRKSLSGTRN